MRKLLFAGVCVLLLLGAAAAIEEEQEDMGEALAELASHAESAVDIRSLQHAASQAELEGGMPRLVELLESILADWRKKLGDSEKDLKAEQTKCTGIADSINGKIKSTNDRIASKDASIKEQTANVDSATSSRTRKVTRKSDVEAEIAKQGDDLKNRASKLTTDLADKDAEIESYLALIDFLKSMQKEIKDGGLIETQAMEMLNNQVASLSAQHQAAMSLASLLAKAAGDYDMDDVKELIALMIDELMKAIKDAQDTKIRYTANFNERKAAIEVVIKGFNEEKAIVEKEISSFTAAIATATTAIENAKSEKIALQREISGFQLELEANANSCSRTQGDLQKGINTWNKKIALLEKILNAVKNTNSKTKKSILDVVKDVDISVPRWETSDWSACSVTCGTGVQTRKVTCAKSVHSLKNCKGDAPAASRACVMNPCPVNCEVSAFGAYSACSAQCGGGVQTRTRTVVKQAQFGGAACPALSENAACNTQACPISVYVRTLGWGDTCGVQYYTSGKVRIFDQEMSFSRGVNVYLAKMGGKGTATYTNSDTYAHEVTSWAADNNVIAKLDEWLSGKHDLLVVTYFDEATNQLSRGITDKLAAVGAVNFRNAAFRSGYAFIRSKSKVLRDTVSRGNACAPVVEEVQVFGDDAINVDYVAPANRAEYVGPWYALNVVNGEAAALVFRATGSNDIHVALSDRNTAIIRSAVQEVVLGGWGNSRSVIRQGAQGRDLTSASTSGIVKREGALYWVSIAKNTIRVGSGSKIGENQVMQANFEGAFPKYFSLGAWDSPVAYNNIQAL